MNYCGIYCTLAVSKEIFLTFFFSYILHNFYDNFCKELRSYVPVPVMAGVSEACALCLSPSSCLTAH